MSLGRILVVDDDPGMRKSMRLLLVRKGYEVIAAEDGEQAFATLESGDNPEKVVLVICDLIMPKGSGLEMTTYVRSHHPSIPVIVVSGSGDAQTVASVLKQGAVDYLTKPVDPAQLIAAVQKAVKDRLQSNDQSAM